MFYTVYDSPLGQLFLTADGENLTGLYLPTPKWNLSGNRRDDLPVFDAVRDWLDRYFRGEAVDGKSLPLAPAGTLFREKVWKRLLEIPFGGLCAYGDIAREISSGMSPQAVGGAVGSNPISIIIPCHRVVGARGQLTGYAGGLHNKQWLLDHEKKFKKELFL